VQLPSDGVRTSASKLGRDLFDDAQLSAEALAEMYGRKPILEKKVSKGDLLERITNSHCFVFAGHGIQDAERPLQSQLVVSEDGGDENGLSIEDVMHCGSNQRGFAYLSVCQVARGHASLPDEAIHLVGALQEQVTPT
jgi:hypothetical protein